MPRLMEGYMPIVPLGVTEHAPTGTTVPLGPVSSNLTQSIYLTGDLICFVAIAAIASSPAGFVAVANGVIACALVNILFALLDMGTYYTGTGWLLGFMRNAQYVYHVESEVGGLKKSPADSRRRRPSVSTPWACFWFHRHPVGVRPPSDLDGRYSVDASCTAGSIHFIFGTGRHATRSPAAVLDSSEASRIPSVPTGGFCGIALYTACGCRAAHCGAIRSGSDEANSRLHRRTDLQQGHHRFGY